MMDFCRIPFSHFLKAVLGAGAPQGIEVIARSVLRPGALPLGHSIL